MNVILSRKSSAQVEPLEQRIAPAVLTDFAPVTVGTPILLDADSSTASIPAGITAGLNGTPLLFVEKGSCLVFTTDFNGNNAVDFNEITGIAAGDGLRLISFVDIHGDIVTNLRPDGTLTDSDGNASNGRDGQILLNNKIESIQLRSIRQDELPLNTLLADKIALSSYSIFGNIYAGGGFGTLTGGLLIDTTGATVQEQRFDGGAETALWVPTKPQFGSIRVGSAASGRLFNFGASLADDSVGQLQPFTPPSNSPGADIINIRASNPATQFNFGTLQAGNGGFNGRGGDIVNVIVGGDTAGGYGLIAGDAGAGPTGQRGGNIENWVDFGSITSEVVIKTGNGGQGLVGRGGDAGSVTFGQILALDTDNDPTTPPVVPKSAASITGRVKITLGDGGSGLTGGGAGGSFPTAKFTPLEPLLAFPLEVVSTWHRPGDIGQVISVDAAGLPLAPANPLYHAIRGIDWDGDGANDIVYTSTQNNGIQGGQLVVVFGNPNFDPTALTPPANNSFDPTRTLFLDTPDNPDALTVGDFNGDGKPDIAVASGSANAGGIQIMLSLYDPVSGAFVGFSDAMYSTLPALGGVAITVGMPFARAPHAVQVFELASGDFDGDGAVDLGVMDEFGFLLLRGDKDLGPNGSPAISTGRLFSDTISNFGLVPFDRTDNLNGAAVRGEFPVVKASALADGGRDMVFAAVQGTRSISGYTYTGGLLAKIPIALGQVDTNRELSDAGKTDKISLTPATTRDFTFLDINRDGRAEISILTASPEGFLIGKAERDALPATIFDTFISDRFGDTPGENRGIRIGGRAGPSNFGLGLSDSGLVGIMTQTSLIGGIHVNSVMVVDYETGADGPAPVAGNLMRFTPPAAGESPNYFSVSRGAIQQFPGPPIFTPDLSLRPFDTYLPFASFSTPATPGVASLILGLPTKDAPLPHIPEILTVLPPTFTSFVSLDRNGFFIKAGDGGDSPNGPGGRAGTVGSSLRLDPATGQAVGTFDIILPAFPQFLATVRIIGGDGGDGFRDAGAGGTLSGISVRFPTTAQNIGTDSSLLFSGNGGNSVKGKGGKGGDLRSVFIQGGDLFVAGSGGNGVKGGDGGSVIGNDLGLDDTTGAIDRGDIDNVTGIQIGVFAGRGGSGIRLGGNGGDINGFTPFFVPVLANLGGFYHLRAGDAGNATIGPGGRGGNIIQCSPRSEQNTLDGTIFALAGRGGNGTKGGDGGSIRDFINESTGERTADSTTFLAGNAGFGTSGPGGTGGSLINVRTDGTGVGTQVYFDLADRKNFELIGDAIVTTLSLPFSRMVAGEGGTSLGRDGGKGGDLIHVLGTASTSTFAMAAGRGGDGLFRGGIGGSVMDAVSNSGSSNGVNKSQVLIIAGEGGDAFSGVVRSSDPLVPGRKLPAAGAGGSIVDFRQLGATDVNVQLIAGNGGNTPNAGSTTDVKSKVGRGGSIQNISVAGRIGDTGDPSDATGAPINPYNPLYGNSSDPLGPNDPIDDRMSFFVRNSLVGTPETVPVGAVALPLVNGDTGNVGIVVGAKGRVRDGDNDGKLDPAPDVVGSVPNGSLINVTASHIMSAVADHVERIASIQVLKNVIATTTGGEYGSDRNVDTTGGTASPNGGVPYTLGAIPGSLDYLRPDGTHSPTPVIGGRLVDGAIVAKTSREPLSDRDFKIG